MPDVPEFDNLFDRFEKGEVREAERVVELDADSDTSTLNGDGTQSVTVDRLVNVADVVNVQLGVVQSSGLENVDVEDLEPTFFDTFRPDSSVSSETVIGAYGEIADDTDENVVTVGFNILDNTDNVIETSDGDENIELSTGQELDDESYDVEKEGDSYTINSDDISHIKVTARGY